MEIPRTLVEEPTQEPKTVPADPFLEMLPFLLSGDLPDKDEPTFAQLPANVGERYYDLAQQRARLAEQGKFATGNDVAIFVSDIGTHEQETYFSGVDVPLVEYSYLVSEEEYSEHLRAAKGIEHRIKQITGNGVSIAIQKATESAIDNAVHDANVAHLIYVGHANSSAISTGVETNYYWDNPSAELTHLKSSFGVFGCGAERDGGPYPRVGLALVAPGGVLYGVPGEHLEEGTPYDFGSLVRYSDSDLAGTFQSPYGNN